MKINFYTNNIQPTFRARFANDSETKKALLEHAKCCPVETLALINTLEAAKVDDVIELKSYGQNGCMRIHGVNTSVNKTIKGPKFVDNRVYNFFENMISMKLSDGKTIGNHLMNTLSPELQEKSKNKTLLYSDIRRNMEERLAQEANLHILDKRVQENNDTIQCLKDCNNRILRMRADRINHFIEKRINEN